MPEQKNEQESKGTLESQLSKAVSELGNSIEAKLDVPQKAALESKFNALPDEVRSAIASKYPGMSIVGMYLVRQAIKEANGKLASNKRPEWYSALKLNASSLLSGDESVRAYGEKMLRQLAEEIDTKESVNLLKKYKHEKDMTTTSPAIKQLAGIFGVSSETLK